MADIDMVAHCTGYNEDDVEYWRARYSELDDLQKKLREINMQATVFYQKKIQLLTLIIELMETASREAPKNVFNGLVLSDFDWLIGIHARINSAGTMKELEFFEKELAEYKTSKEKT